MLGGVPVRDQRGANATTTSSAGEIVDAPVFSELPTVADSGARHAWGLFGDRDEFGTLNKLTPERVSIGAKEIVTGERISLQLPPDLPDPPMYRRLPIVHEIMQTGRNTWDDRLDNFYPQAGTHWDSFRHVRFREHGFYGGLTEDPPDMGSRLSAHHWSKEGIVGRGVLVDLHGYFEQADESFDAFDARAITAEELQRVVAEQGVEVFPGDVLCLRTGWASRYKSASSEERQEIGNPTSPLSFAGLSASETMSELLWNWGVSALAADNPAVEDAPGDAAVGSLHRRLLVQLGMPLGELFDFDELAARSREETRWSFFFVSVPLAIVGGVGSPANAIAIR